MINKKPSCTDFCSSCQWVNSCGTDGVDYPCYEDKTESSEAQYDKYIKDLYEPYESEARLQENEQENELYYKEILRGGGVI